MSIKIINRIFAGAWKTPKFSVTPVIPNDGPTQLYAVATAVMLSNIWSLRFVQVDAGSIAVNRMQATTNVITYRAKYVKTLRRISSESSTGFPWRWMTRITLGRKTRSISISIWRLMCHLSSKKEVLLMILEAFGSIFSVIYRPIMSYNFCGDNKQFFWYSKN